jgi:geranylgeranyl transferase type-2 subunit alpha
MHGRKRAEYKARLGDPKVAAALQHKANQWFKLNDDLLNRKGSLDLLSNLLLVNPDPIYLWNRRRSMLDESIELQQELTLTQKCLERNPKAYGAWFHRKWCILRAGLDDATLKKELALCSQFLSLDERNFHCWSYRRFIVGCLCGSAVGKVMLEDDKVLFGCQVGTDSAIEGILDVSKVQEVLESELNFTAEKIQQNFSNGSAFHYRTKLLPHIGGKISLANELELVHSAIFTEPDDQTAWWYLEFLLENYTVDLEAEKMLLEELLEAEGGESKWALLGMYQVLSRMDGQNDRKEQVLHSLISLDPDRKARYQDMLKSIA